MRLIDADALPIKFDGHTVSVWKNDLDAAPTVNPYEWISVEERLPIELHQQVLVIDVKGTMAIGVLVNKENLYFDSNCSYGITHWMPLPEAPTKGGE